MKVAPETLGETTPPVWYRRFVSIPLIVTLCCATIPAPTNAATSTATEVQLGQAEDKAILASANLVTDPLLNAWADGIGDALFAQTARKDVPYSIKLLDVPDVNAFSTLGGFIYIDAGLLDFAQSDDELAGVTGHETGHIERRHALENESKAGILSALYALGSMFSPIVYNFGQIVAAGAMAKIERDDEYQADRYGLMLMTRAGYDPDAMVSFMQHLGAYTNEHNSFVDAYLADHPDTPKRVAALAGYPELDPTVRTPAQRLAAAIHDQDEGRYAIAARDFSAILATDPGNTIARYHLGEAQIALGADAQAEANLNQAAAAGSPQTRALAEAHIAALHVAPGAQPPDLQPLRDRIAAARQTFALAAVAIETRAASGRRQSSAIATREQTIADEMPDLSQLQASSGSRVDTMLTNLAAMSRALDAADAKSAQTFAGAGSAVNDRSGGLIRANGRVLAAMDEQLNAEPLGAGTLAALPDYPRMLASLAAADADMVRAVDAARASLAVLDLALVDLDAFIRALHAVRVRHGDIDESDDAALVPVMTRAVDSLNRAAVAASQAGQLYDLARAEQLQARINLLGLTSTPERYATLQHAIDVRFHNATIGERAMLDQRLSPGEVVAASIVAADTGTTPEGIVAEARSTGHSIVELANDRGMAALALTVFMRLILLDYTDDPQSEARVPA